MPKVKKELKSDKKVTKAEKTKSARSGLTIPVYGLDGKEKSTLEVAKEMFSVKVNHRLIAQYVRVFLANQRQGTAFAKTRGEVIGTTKKIYRQKGTGNARHGSKKAPIFVGGGVVGGPRPRDYSLKMNSKQTRKVLFDSLTLKLKEKNIFGLADEFLKVEPKTAVMFKFLKSVGADNDKSLVVLPKMERNNLMLSMRNLKKLTVSDAVSVNPYDLLKNKRIFIVEGALKVMTEHFLKVKSGKKNEN